MGAKEQQTIDELVREGCVSYKGLSQQLQVPANAAKT
jgi:hypothetical protein